jgi:peptidoglycan/xylan/chitin deacetylase (PgdA/CDA1 family)
VSGRALRWLLAHAAGRWSPRSGPARLTIVRHHRVYADGERALYHLGVSESVLRAQVETCVRAGAAPCTVREGLARLGRGEPGHAVAFSFDDGYADNVTRALPVFERAGAKATFFLAAGLMETRTAPWWDELAFVLERAGRTAARFACGGAELALEVSTPAGRGAALRALLPLLRVAPAEQRARLGALREALAVREAAPCELAEWPLARRLAEAGMEIGAHTMTHPFLTTLAAGEQAREIADSAALAHARTGAVVTGLAYPVGDHDDRTVEAASGAGLAYAVTTAAGDCTPGTPAFRLPRRALPEGASLGPGGRVSASMVRAELKGAFDGLRGRRAEAGT